MTLQLTAEELVARQRLQQKLWREVNPERVKGYYLKHKARPEHLERVRQWKSAHREEINSRVREKRRLKQVGPQGVDADPEPSRSWQGTIGEYITRGGISYSC